MPTLYPGDNRFVSDENKANEFGRYYQSVGKEKEENICDEIEAEFDKIEFKEEPFLNLVVNLQFQFNELERVLQRKKGSTPGNDNIGYEVYKNLPE